MKALLNPVVLRMGLLSAELWPSFAARPPRQRIEDRQL